jgi:hypothetical protein
MRILTDDPESARDIYEARALAIKCIKKHGHIGGSGECLQAIRNGLTITYHPNRLPRLLTIDAPERVLALEWNHGDAWRLVIETFDRGRWQSRLKTTANPKPWLNYLRPLVLFTASGERRG